MTDFITQKKYNGLGHIELNRPQALNALSLDMITDMRRILSDFADDDDVRAVMVTSASEKAFCAGGDVKSVAIAAREMQQGRGDGQLCHDIFYQEYLLNSEIYHFRKPYISFIDGICMGGGMGISLHGSHKIVSEKTMFAMPEVFIGFFPDVGSGHVFNTIDQGIAAWLLLSGARIGGAEMLHLGLADYYIESRGMQALQQSLIETDWRRSEAISILASQLSGYCDEKVTVENPLDEHQDNISKCFAATDVEAILNTMRKSDDPLIKSALDRMKTACPASMHLTLSHLRWAKGCDFNDIMNNEFRLSQYFMRHPDFYEGVRAVLIDKDNQATWKSSLQDLSPDLYQDIQNQFSSLELEMHER